MSHAACMNGKRMTKCVFRTDLRLHPVSELLPCINVSELIHRPDAPTVEECVHMLLADDEICLGRSDKREIRQGARVVGYIHIVDAF
jgi:hypothetical protein